MFKNDTMYCADVDMQKLKKLFQEKRYSEVVFEIEASTSEKNRSSALYNLLGVCGSYFISFNLDPYQFFYSLE